MRLKSGKHSNSNFMIYLYSLTSPFRTATFRAQNSSIKHNQDPSRKRFLAPPHIKALFGYSVKYQKEPIETEKRRSLILYPVTC